MTLHVSSLGQGRIRQADRRSGKLIHLIQFKATTRFGVCIALALVMMLLLVTPVAAAPSGTLNTTENPDGSFNVLASVTWDACPEVCDWKINVQVVESPDRCAQRALLNVPEGVPYGPGVPLHPEDGPFTGNGTRTAFMINMYYARPPYTHMCFAAVGLAQRGEGVYSPSEECPDPASGAYLNESQDLSRGRCPRLYPIGAVALPPAPRPLRIPLPAAGSPVRPTLVEARRALRVRGIRGETRLRRAGRYTVRAVVRNVHGTRRYRITKRAGQVRVRRESTRAR